MRVLIASNCYPPNFIGGAELVAHRHARRLRALGHEVHVFSGDHASPVPRHHCWQENYEDVDVTRVRLTHLDTELRFTNFLNRPVDAHFRALVARWHPDVVHFHNTTGLSLASYHHCHRLGLPGVVTLHDHWGYCMRNTLTTPDGRPCADIHSCAQCHATIEDGPGRLVPESCRQDYFRRRLATVRRFITPSAYLATQYLRAGFDARRFEVISNGIDSVPPAPPSVAGAPCRFATICYLGEHKGVHTIIEALRRLPRNLAWEFNFVGFGRLESLLRRMARNEGLAHRIHFWGRVSNARISEVFAKTDVYVLASTWPENEPVSILEALAHGVPVIATAVGGVPELVHPGVNGWLVPTNDIGRMQQVFVEAISRPEKVRRLAAGALRMGTRWPELRQVDRLLAIYERVRHEPPCASDSPLMAIAGDCGSGEAPVAIAAIKQARPDIDLIPLNWLEPDEADAVCAVLEASPVTAAIYPPDIPRAPARLESVAHWLEYFAHSVRPPSRVVPPVTTPTFVKD